VDQERNRDRIKAGIGVALFHALLGYALITGLGYEVVRQVSDNLKVFEVAPEPPPPPPPVEKSLPAEMRTKAPEGAAAPPSLKAQPSPIVAPPPKVRLPVPPPVAAVPEPTPLPAGADISAGVSTVDGTGTGTGGEGKGTGSGGEGTASGGGGGGRQAARVRGSFTPRDYSRIVGPRLLQGTVYVRYTVQQDGHVSNCAVTRSSGHFLLDRATCEIIEDRFRYRPALDSEGRPVASTKNTSFSWSPQQG
jgi:protein TonB